MKRISALLGLLLPLLTAAQGTPEKVTEWSSSPARSRLAEIQPYKPEVRRNRSGAIAELQQEVAAFRQQLMLAQDEFNRQERLAKRKKPEAWSAEKLDEAETLLGQMWERLSEMQTYLDEVQTANAPILKYLERKQAHQAAMRNRASSAAGAGYDPADGEDVDEDAEKRALKRATTQPVPPSAEPHLPPPPEEREPDED